MGGNQNRNKKEESRDLDITEGIGRTEQKKVNKKFVANTKAGGQVLQGS